MQRGKRGQELSINTIVLVVIAVLVLAFLSIGFAVGWKKIFPFVGPQNNVQELSDKCKLACNTQAVYDYCSAERTVTLDREITQNGVTIPKETKASCLELSLVTELGIEACPGLCKNPVYRDLFKPLAPTAATTQ